LHLAVDAGPFRLRQPKQNHETTDIDSYDTRFDVSSILRHQCDGMFEVLRVGLQKLPVHQRQVREVLQDRMHLL